MARDEPNERDERDERDEPEDSNEPDEPGPEPVIFGEKRTDEGWKEKAQREKERLAAEAEEAERERMDVPPASFGALLEELILRAMMGLGQIVDPVAGEAPEVNLPIARYAIDMLSVLEEKTRGNLSPEEARALGEALHGLRMAFVHVSRAPRAAPGEGASPGPDADPKKPRIIL